MGITALLERDNLYGPAVLSFLNYSQKMGLKPTRINRPGLQEIWRINDCLFIFKRDRTGRRLSARSYEYMFTFNERLGRYLDEEVCQGLAVNGILVCGNHGMCSVPWTCKRDGYRQNLIEDIRVTLKTDLARRGRSYYQISGSLMRGETLKQYTASNQQFWERLLQNIPPAVMPLRLV